MASKSKQTEKPKRGPGRPRLMEMPPLIDDTPENILKTVLAGPPKKKWRFMEEHERKHQAYYEARAKNPSE